MIRQPYKSGEKYGRLTSVREATAKGYWFFRCSCGVEKSIFYAHVRRGLIKSCGCLNREAARSRMTTHGFRYRPEYRVWQNMNDRCSNPNNKRFADWGGRGIKVCDRWRDSFLSFISDVGPMPAPGMQIDRVDNDGDYEPSNVMWRSRLAQARNKRNNRFVTVNGERMIIADAALVLGLSWGAIRKRVRHGDEVAR